MPVVTFIQTLQKYFFEFFIAKIRVSLAQPMNKKLPGKFR